jgi:hypothetical protein
MQCDVAESASELCANYEYAAVFDQQTESTATKSLEEAGGESNRMHALHCTALSRPDAQRLCGRSGRRATNYVDVADACRWELCGCSKFLVAFLPGEDPAATVCGCGRSQGRWCAERATRLAEGFDHRVCRKFVLRGTRRGEKEEGEGQLCGEVG